VSFAGEVAIKTHLSFAHFSVLGLFVMIVHGFLNIWIILFCKLYFIDWNILLTEGYLTVRECWNLYIHHVLLLWKHFTCLKYNVRLVEKRFISLWAFVVLRYDRVPTLVQRFEAKFVRLNILKADTIVILLFQTIFLHSKNRCFVKIMFLLIFHVWQHF
jgi:hypothetical protein